MEGGRACGRGVVFGVFIVLHRNRQHRAPLVSQPRSASTGDGLHMRVASTRSLMNECLGFPLKLAEGPPGFWPLSVCDNHGKEDLVKRIKAFASACPWGPLNSCDPCATTSLSAKETAEFAEQACERRRHRCETPACTSSLALSI